MMYELVYMPKPKVMHAMCLIKCPKNKNHALGLNYDQIDEPMLYPYVQNDFHVIVMHWNCLMDCSWD